VIAAVEGVADAIKAPWRRFWSWIDATRIRATISGLEDDLRILEGMPGPNEAAVKLIRDELEANKQALFLITRKGGV
jgi:hypothetical protein